MSDAATDGNGGVKDSPSFTKLGGFELWEKTLGSPTLIVAPMVDQSEAAWRMLSRKYGAQLCYTPMFHANVFVNDARYRKDCLTTYPEDRPLIIQFCCNNPDTLLEAARHCVGRFDAVDINLGCPQSIARRGHYGAFLQDEWDLLHKLVNIVHTQLDIPVTCKIRIFDDVDKTIRYARMLEAAGCQLLTVHGRTREMKGPLTGLANWDVIKKVRESVNIPVFANGNIQYLRDVHRCLEYTGVQGVMSAEGNLHNPALFTGKHPLVWEVADEYLELVRKYPCPFSYARGHIFKILHYCLLLPVNHDVRSLVARANSLEQLSEAVHTLRLRFERYTADGGPLWNQDDPNFDGVVSKLPLPPYLCQPHERQPIEDHLRKMEANQAKQRLQREQRQRAGLSAQPEQKRCREHDPDVISKRKLKKLARGIKIGENRVFMERCSLCCNPKGLRCEYLLCRVHCRRKCYDEGLDCTGHRILCKTKRQKAREYYGRLEAEKASKVTQGSPEGQVKVNGDAAQAQGQGDGTSAGCREASEGNEVAAGGTEQKDGVNCDVRGDVRDDQLTAPASVS